MVYLDMNLRETIPSQTDIEEFLARDFFPKYPDPMPLAETVDMVQLQFEVPDDARALPCPRAHGTDGTILECLTWFAMKRLEERGFPVLRRAAGCCAARREFQCAAATCSK